MPCIHKDLDHDTATEIFVAGFVGAWPELLGLSGLAFWALLGMGLFMRVGGWPVVGVAFAALLIWSHRRALLCAGWVAWMLVLCALELSYGGCMYYVSGGRPLPGYDAVIRYRPTEPKVPMVRPMPVQTVAGIPVLPGRGGRLCMREAKECELLGRLDGTAQDKPSDRCPLRARPLPPLLLPVTNQCLPPATDLPRWLADPWCSPIPRPLPVATAAGAGPAPVVAGQAPPPLPTMMDIWDSPEGQPGAALPPLAPALPPTLAASLPAQPAPAPVLPEAPAPVVPPPAAPAPAPALPPALELAGGPPGPGFNFGADRSPAPGFRFGAGGPPAPVFVSGAAGPAAPARTRARATLRTRLGTGGGRKPPGIGGKVGDNRAAAKRQAHGPPLQVPEPLPRTELDEELLLKELLDLAEGSGGDELEELPPRPTTMAPATPAASAVAAEIDPIPAALSPVDSLDEFIEWICSGEADLEALAPQPTTVAPATSTVAADIAAVAADIDPIPAALSPVDSLDEFIDWICSGADNTAA